MLKLWERIKALFFDSTTYEYYETETKISNGKIEIKRVKKTGLAAKEEFEKAAPSIQREFERHFT